MATGVKRKEFARNARARRTHVEASLTCHAALCHGRSNHTDSGCGLLRNREPIALRNMRPPRFIGGGGRVRMDHHEGARSCPLKLPDPRIKENE